MEFPHCDLDGSTLKDGLAGSAIELNASAAVVANSLVGGATVAETAAILAHTANIAIATAVSDVRAFINASDERALICVRRDWKTRCHPRNIAHRCASLALLVPRSSERRRFGGTFAGALRATARASRAMLVLAVMSCVAMMLLFAQQASAVQSLWLVTLYASVPLMVLLVALVTVVAHEIGHLVAARLLRAGRAWFVVDGTKMHLVHPAPNARSLAIIAIAGPCCGTASALVIGLALWVFSSLAAVLVGCAALALAHAVSLLPFCRDGHNLLLARSSRKRFA